MQCARRKHQCYTVLLYINPLIISAMLVFSSTQSAQTPTSAPTEAESAPESKGRFRRNTAKALPAPASEEPDPGALRLWQLCSSVLKRSLGANDCEMAKTTWTLHSMMLFWAANFKPGEEKIAHDSYLSMQFGGVESTLPHSPGKQVESYHPRGGLRVFS